LNIFEFLGTKSSEALVMNDEELKNIVLFISFSNPSEIISITSL
jgi:hypothetical protein